MEDSEVVVEVQERMGGKRLAEPTRGKRRPSTQSTNRALGQAGAITAENHPGKVEEDMVLEEELV